MISLPVLFFGTLVATLYGAAFHLIKGGSAGRLLLYMVLAWVGFWTGQYLGARLDLEFFRVGAIHLGTATAVVAVFLLAGDWLIRLDPEQA